MRHNVFSSDAIPAGWYVLPTGSLLQAGEREWKGGPARGWYDLAGGEYLGLGRLVIRQAGRVNQVEHGPGAVA